jgi:F-type H+-transporting ATPase subunit delta
VTAASAQPRQYALGVFAAATEPTIAALRAVADQLAAQPDTLAGLERAETPFAERQARLAQLLPQDAPTLAGNLLGAMLESGDLATLHAVVGHLAAMASGGPGARVAVVTTAIGLGPRERELLASKLREQHGEDLGFLFETDPAILGGVTVRVGDRVIDGSVAAKLSALSASLLTPH